MVVYAPAQIISAPVQIISAPVQLITAPAQPPATGAVVYTALFLFWPSVYLAVHLQLHLFSVPYLRPSLSKSSLMLLFQETGELLKSAKGSGSNESLEKMKYKYVYLYPVGS